MQARRANAHLYPASTTATMGAPITVLTYLSQDPALLLAAEFDVERAIAALIIAVSLLLGSALLLKPAAFMGHAGSSWGDFCASRLQVIGAILRLVGVLVLGGGGYYGITIFQQKAQIQVAENPAVEAQSVNQSDPNEEHEAVRKLLDKIAPGEYASVDQDGTKLFVWTTPAGEKRVASTTAMIEAPTDDQGRPLYDPSDLEVLVGQAVRKRRADWQALYDELAWEKVESDIILNLFPRNATDLTPTVKAQALFDPIPAAPWNSLDIIFYVVEKGERPGRVLRKSHLDRYRKAPAELWSLAKTNLETQFFENRNKMEREAKGNLTILVDESGVITAYPLSANFHGVISRAVGGENFFFTIPDFTKLILLPTSKEGSLEELTKETDAIFDKHRAGARLSKSVFMSTPEGVREYKAR